MVTQNMVVGYFLQVDKIMPYDPNNFQNPLAKNHWFKHERHNGCKTHNLYNFILNEATATIGVTIFYYPVSEYSLDTLTSIWGEDSGKSYKEKYTMKAIPEQQENDTFQFNSFGGISKEESERILYIPKDMFTHIVGRENPLPSDFILYTQNNIIYEVLSLDDNEGIVAGKELYWKVTLAPRLVEGEKMVDCDAQKPEVVDPLPEEYCESLDLEFNNDGTIEEDGVEVPAPTPENNDNDILENNRQDTNVLRNSSDWGANW